MKPGSLCPCGSPRTGNQIVCVRCWHKSPLEERRRLTEHGLPVALKRAAARAILEAAAAHKPAAHTAHQLTLI
jgi:hypothetical protein